MEQKKTTADQVRPFLAAMDRSIDSARRRRLNDHDTGENTSNASSPSMTTNATARPIASNDPTETLLGQGQTGANDDAPRFKARPKRPTAFGNGAAPSQTYRTQAG